jgi:hypothetical protein
MLVTFGFPCFPDFTSIITPHSGGMDSKISNSFSQMVQSGVLSLEAFRPSSSLGQCQENCWDTTGKNGEKSSKSGQFPALKF